MHSRTAVVRVGYGERLVTPNPIHSPGLRSALVSAQGQTSNVAVVNHTGRPLAVVTEQTRSLRGIERRDGIGLDFHSNHGHPQSAGLHLPEGACFMSTMRVYTREFRESAVGLVLSQGLSIRVAAEDLGMPYHTLHSWVRDQRRARRKTVVKATPKTMVDAQARVRELEAEVRKLTLEKDILKKAAAYFAREQS